PRQQARDPLAEPLQARRAHLGVGALADEEGALPVVAAVDEDGELAAGDPTDPARRVGLPPGEPEPPHIDGHPERARDEPGRRPYRGAPPVAGDGEARPDLVLAAVGAVAVAHARHAVAVVEQADGLGVAAQRERGL